MNIVEDIKNSPFKNLKKSYHIGKAINGTPYFFPRNYLKYGIKIVKELPKFRKYNYFKIFNYYLMYGSPIIYKIQEFSWKNKFETPRFEWPLVKHLYIGPFQIYIGYNSVYDDNDHFFEQYLWWKYYCDEDLEKAKNTWPWTSNGISTWNDDFIK